MRGLFTTRGSTLLRVLVSAMTAVLIGVAGPAAAATSVPVPAQSRLLNFLDMVVNDVGDYWAPQLRALGRPGLRFSYSILDARESRWSPCGLAGDPYEVRGAKPAFYCISNNHVYLSAPWIYDYASNNGRSRYGMAVVVAHEVGHAVQAELGLPRRANVEPRELQADCFTGMWVRDQSRTGEANAQDISDARRAVQTFGDYDTASPGHHGTADERVGAWTDGFTRGFRSCLARNR